MSFDPRDPYDAAALYDMWLNCHGCPATFDYEPERSIDLDYYHEIGQRAKASGWVIVEMESVDELEGDIYRVLCPACAAKQGISANPDLRGNVPEPVEALCRAIEGSAIEAA